MVNMVLLHAVLLFIFGPSALPIVVGLLFGLSIAYAVQYDAKKKNADKVCKVLAAAKDEALKARKELAAQKATAMEEHRLLVKASKYITYATYRDHRYRTLLAEAQQKAKLESEARRRAMDTASIEVKAAQELVRAFNNELIDLKRSVAKLTQARADAQDEARFAKEELDAAAYMHEVQMRGLLDELAELKSERRRGRQCCVDDSGEHADGEMAASGSFSLANLVCSSTALADTHDSPRGGQPTLDEVRAYWQAARPEPQHISGAQPTPAHAPAPLIDSSSKASSLVSSSSFQDRSPGRRRFVLPPVHPEFADCVPLLLPGFD